MAGAHDLPKPWRKVLHTSWSEGYRLGTRLHFILECGHSIARPASKGHAKKLRCIECWTIDACDRFGHVTSPTPGGCGRCGRARKQLGSADGLIAKQVGL